MGQHPRGGSRRRSTSTTRLKQWRSFTLAGGLDAVYASRAEERRQLPRPRDCGGVSLPRWKPAALPALQPEDAPRPLCPSPAGSPSLGRCRRVLDGGAGSAANRNAADGGVDLAGGASPSGWWWPSPSGRRWSARFAGSRRWRGRSPEAMGQPAAGSTPRRRGGQLSFRLIRCWAASLTRRRRSSRARR